MGPIGCGRAGFEKMSRKQRTPRALALALRHGKEFTDPECFCFAIHSRTQWNVPLFVLMGARMIIIQQPSLAMSRFDPFLIAQTRAGPFGQRHPSTASPFFGFHDGTHQHKMAPPHSRSVPSPIPPHSHMEWNGWLSYKMAGPSNGKCHWALLELGELRQGCF